MIPHLSQPSSLKLHSAGSASSPDFDTADRERVIIGRATPCDFVVADAAVSREHAKIERTSNGWQLEDLGSTHGTFLNTIRLEPEEKVALSDGDSLRIGTHSFSVVLESPGDHRADRPATMTIKPPSTPREAETLATRPSMFQHLVTDDQARRELSWTEFHERYGPVILGFARNAGIPTEEAEDVLQDVMLSFFRVTASFEYDPAKGRFRGYLKRMTLNAIRDRYRRKRPAAGLDPSVFEHAPSPLDSLWSREWTRSIVDRALREARSAFESRTWQAFELYGRRGVPVEEVATQLNLSPDGVRHAKHRVARAIREAIERIRAQEG